MRVPIGADRAIVGIEDARLRIVQENDVVGLHAPLMKLLLQRIVLCFRSAHRAIREAIKQEGRNQEQK